MFGVSALKQGKAKQPARPKSNVPVFVRWLDAAEGVSG
jgi:hypothetical protein